MTTEKNKTDEFEFKPITDGLGFHKKVVNLQEELRKTSTVKSEFSQKMPSAPASLIKPKINELFKTLPGADLFEENEQELKTTKKLVRDSFGEETRGVPRFKFQPYTSMPTIVTPEISNSLLGKEIIEDVAVEKITATEKEISLETENTTEVELHIGAVLFDSVVVLGLACLFSVGLMLGAGVDLVTIFGGAAKDFTAQVGFAVLIFSIIELYVIITRSIFGSTLGEWAFDIQLGNEKQFNSAWYPLRVFFRTLVVALTGYVILPFISSLAGKDVTGRITGLRLTRNF